MIVQIQLRKGAQDLHSTPHHQGDEKNVEDMSDSDEQRVIEFHQRSYAGQALRHLDGVPLTMVPSVLVKETTEAIDPDDLRVVRFAPHLRAPNRRALAEALVWASSVNGGR